MKEKAASIVERIRDGDGGMEEEFSSDDGIGVEAGLAYIGVDLLEVLEAPTVCQQRTAEMLGMVHYQEPIRPSKLPPFFELHIWK